MIKNINNLGDAAIYCDFGDKINEETNARVISTFKCIKNSNIEGITNLAPSYNKLIITFDLHITNFLKIKREVENLNLESFKHDIFKTIEIPICFHKNFALDLDRLKKNLNLSKDKIIEIFLEKTYFCYMTGFIAGMPFLGDINDRLRLNRLETPRVKVPKGSVGITEQFCNIYSYESPGGWNIIGNTPISMFNKANENNPTTVKAGDKIKFFEISKEEYRKLNDR